jgi:hypothetical protein
MMSEPVPDGEGEGAFRFAITARDITAKQNVCLTVTAKCINCVVLFTVDRLQGP